MESRTEVPLSLHARAHFVAVAATGRVSARQSGWEGPRFVFAPRGSASGAWRSAAVPDEPEMIAPAWPIVFPGGAEKPAMYENTGFDRCSAT